MKALFPILLCCLLPAPAAHAQVWLYVLGIAQDAGYPQIGCRRPDCVQAWENPERRRLATSVAVIDESSASAYLFEATPHVSEQLHRLKRAFPDTQLGGVFVTHAHIGHYAGLMFFGHESMGARGIPVYAMPRMQEFLSTSGPWEQLVRYGNIELRGLEGNRPVALGSELTITPFRVPHRDEYSETVGYRIDGPNRSAVFIPDIDKWQRWDTDIRDIVRDVDYALLDGTFFDQDELPGREMSAIPHPFVVESMALFDTLDEGDRAKVIFIHLNQSNPLVRGDREARRLVEERGYRVATERMRLPL
ncbi:MAG: MBL fold metallo-hydrolase [Woeseiaceae bacterium]|nr:MBL fold metallo-hydrolase [Woeseiaceae bacterium]